MPWTPPRLAVSTATTITVNSNALPSWLPAAGSWGAVSLNTAESIKGDFPPAFPSSRNLGALFDDYTGAVWNPYIGTYGAMLLHGGGHSATSSYSPMLDNAIYMWRADTRLWSRLTDPMYPGSVPPFGPYDWGWSVPRTLDDLTEANEPLKTYGELQTGVPCSNHSRWLPCILPPSAGGGSSGSFILPAVTSAHITGAGAAGQAHILNCATAIASGSATGYQAWSRLGALNTLNRRTRSGCVDSTRAYVYTSNVGSPASYELMRLNIGTGTWTDVTPSGWLAHGAYGQPMMYSPTHDMVVMMKDDFTLKLWDAASASVTIVTPSASSGTPPTGSGPDSGEGWSSVSWCPDLGSYGAIVHYNPSNHVVKALYAPQFPKTGTAWSWATLSASNTPTGRGDAVHWYARFQYAPALKSFFLCSMPNDSYGGIVCFRPSEIP